MSANEIELATPTHSDLAHEDTTFKDDALPSTNTTADNTTADTPAIPDKDKTATVPIMSSEHISTPVASPVADASEDSKVETTEPAPVAEPTTEPMPDNDDDLFGDKDDSQLKDTDMPDASIDVPASAPADASAETAAPVSQPVSESVSESVSEPVTATKTAADVAAEKNTRPATTLLEENPAKRIKTEELAPTTDELLPPDDARNPPEGITAPLPKHQAKFALASLKAVKRLRDAGPFLAPVDIVKLNIPTYPDFIKNPMDLGTMEKKLSGNEYTSVRAFAEDMDLIVQNCEKFNGLTSDISAMARNIRVSFQKHLRNMPPYDQSAAPSKTKRKSTPTAPAPKSQRIAANAAAAAANTPKSAAAATASAVKKSSPPPGAADRRPKREIHPPRSKDLPYEVKPRRRKGDAELKFCGQVIKELTSKKHEAYSYPFLEPVDPVALNLPNYFAIVKQPMDLSTISKKYNDDAYSNADEFEADIRLMFKNCYAFNPEGTHVNMYGHRLESVFDKKWAEKPVPVSTPAYSSEEEDGYDTEDQLELSSNPAIKFLENQLERMTKELAKLKKEALKESRERKLKTQRQRKKSVTKKTDGRRKSSATGGPGRKSSLGSLTAPEHITFDMKKELSEAISTLDDTKLDTVVSIIRESMPGVADDPDGEIELDIDTMPTETVAKLYNYVIHGSFNGRPAAGAAGAAANGTNGDSRPTKGKKSKPLSEAEQSRQIKEIQDQIKQFDKAEEGGEVGGAAAAASSDEEDDDDSGSSSEED